MKKFLFHSGMNGMKIQTLNFFTLSKTLTNKQTILPVTQSSSSIPFHSIQFSSQKQNKKEFILKEFLCMECVCLYARGSNICLNSIQKHLRQTQKKNILLTPLKLQPKNFFYLFFSSFSFTPCQCVQPVLSFFSFRRDKSTLAESILFNISEWPQSSLFHRSFYFIKIVIATVVNDTI